MFDMNDDGLRETEKLVEEVSGAGRSRTYLVDVTDAGHFEAVVADIVDKRRRDKGPREQRRGALGHSGTGAFARAMAPHHRGQLDGVVHLHARRSPRDGTSRYPGRIVTVASVHSVAPGHGVIDYDASKGGLLMLTRSLARELAPTGSPSTPSDRASSYQSGRRRLQGIPRPRRAENSPGPCREPSDVAGVVSFLLGPDADYMTGSLLIVDGGMLLTADLERADRTRCQAGPRQKTRSG